jgi:hypothetical protein
MAYGGVAVYIHIFLSSALAGGEWSASGPGHFTPEERVPGTHWKRVWVGPRAGLDDVVKEKFLTPPGLEIRPLGLLARSQSLYRLRYSLSGTIIKTQFSSIIYTWRRRMYFSDFCCHNESPDGRDVEAGLADRMVYQRHVGGFLIFRVCAVKTVRCCK